MAINNDKFIGFFDMLGLQSIAAYDINKYSDSLIDFQTVTIGAIKKTKMEFTNCNIECYMFSDCAYIEASKLDVLIYFFRILRLALFTKQIYFQAAITKGNLNCSSDDEQDYIRTTIFQGTDAVKVYQLQNNFKGIGIFIDKSIVNLDNPKLSTKITTSIFQPDENKYQFKTYYDISFEHPNNNIGMLDTIKTLIQTYRRMRILNIRASRYYISAICTIISNLNKNDIIQIKDDKKILTSEITDFLFDKSIGNNELDIFRILFLNRVYNLFKKRENSSINLSLCNAIFDQIKLSKFELLSKFKDIGEIPSYILETQNKEFLASYLSDT